jgi:Rne/Rng family ribonuclease
MSKEMFVSLTPHETKVAVNEDDLLAEVYFERENEYTLAGSIYKGRVTRVLPGMQSAFVDIGLERDAFLYVSDFLELEDEDEQVDTVRPDAPREQRNFDRPERSERPSRSDRPRRDHGRSDRAASDRGTGVAPVTRHPEHVEPIEPEAYFTNNHEPSSGAPTVFEGPGGFDEEERAAETPAPPVSEPRGDRDRNDRQGGGWRGRRGRRGGRGGRGGRFDEARPASAEERPREQRHQEPSYGPPAGYQPIVLPGESISKYRNVAPVNPASSSHSDDASQHANHVSETETETETTPVIESPSFQQEYPETPITAEAEHVAEEQSEIEQAPPRHTGTRYQRYDEPEQRSSGVLPLEADIDDHERLDQMNVATVFGGVEATRDPVPSEQSTPAIEQPIDRPSEIETETISAPRRMVEEEVIEEEEAPDAVLGEHLDDAEYEELEEETIEPYAAHNHDEPVGEMLTEAVEETDEEEAIEEDEVEDNGNGYAETESEEYDETEEGENGQAEVRASNGTADFQQRAPRRDAPGFDRRRGRRGGRRVRGGGSPRISTQRQSIQISDLLKEGQEILVQIAKEPIGKKGARITSHIALPGRFMVYMPTVSHIGVSRKIASDEERQRLKRIVGAEREGGHGGFIVRTAAEGVSEEDLKQDIKFLKGLWSEIKTRADNGKSPSLIYHDLNLVERLLRDLLSEDFTHIWVDNEAEYERILRFVNRFQPNMVRRIRLYTKETPLFEQFGVQEEINKALKSKVWLKSGGYIVINQTEALVAIDVNTGKYVGKTTRLEDTIVKTNVDAIKEIVRQIRLRDLGGIIVIDFIDMDERKNRQKVMQALEEALVADRAPSKVLQFNDFGLVAITRKRVKHSLERVLGQPCPICTGTGLVKSVETVCNEIYVEMKKLRRQFEGREVLLRVNPEVAKQLKANNAKWLNDLEELTGKTIIIKSDPSLHPEQFDM